MWTGGALGMPQEDNEFYMCFLSMKKIDDRLIILGANSSPVTGLLCRIRTKRGFFRRDKKNKTVGENDFKTVTMDEDEPK
jgi:hypothetical protein